MERVALLVKYQPPSQRISGVIGFLTPLAKFLGRACDVHVVTSQVPGAPQRDSTDGYEVHRVGWPFPVSAGRSIASLRPDVSVVVSSIYQLRRAALYFGVLEAVSTATGKGARSVFYQVTNPDSSPRGMFRRLASRADLVLCSTDEMATTFSEALTNRVETLTPGVDIEALSRVKPVLKENGFRVGFVNHLNRVKGLDVALDVFTRVAASVSDVEFVVAGVGEMAEQVPAAIGGRPVRRYGWLPEEERFSLMSSCDVMVLPFRTGVSVLGLSQTVLECLALGSVVIGTDTASITPVINHGRDGLLMSNPAEGAALVQVLHEDKDLRSRLVAAGRDKVAHAFDIRARAESLLRLLFNEDSTPHSTI